MKKILIVDDRTENRIMLANYFKLFSVSDENKLIILQADNSAAAIDLAYSEKPDLILMDIKLESDEAGLDAARKIKQNEETKDITIWAVTAYVSLGNDAGVIHEQQLCQEAGCSEYILKPFNPAELMQKISAALNIPIPEEIVKRMNS